MGDAETRGRERFLRVAAELFARKGYAATSVADIQSGCGLAAGSGALYKHFPSKEALLREVLDRHLAAIAADRAGADLPAASSLLSCAQQLTANATDAGLDVQLRVHPEKVHGWMVLPRLPATRQATAEVTDWITRRLADTRPRTEDPRRLQR